MTPAIKPTLPPPGFPTQPGAAPGVTYTAEAPGEATAADEAPVVTPKPKRAAGKRTGTNADAVAEGPVAGTPNDADAALPGEGKAAKPAGTRKAAAKRK